MTKKELKIKIKALGDIEEKQKKEIVCSFIGHSNIVTGCFGYIYCGRCEAQVGDALGGYYRNNNAVQVGHNCETCRENYKKLTWKDKYLAPSKKEVFSELT